LEKVVKENVIGKLILPLHFPNVAEVYQKAGNESRAILKIFSSVQEVVVGEK
jgi:hypothetical protein